MTIYLIHLTTGTLAFEVKDDVGECLALEEIIIDVEGAGVYFACGGLNLNGVVTDGLQGREIGGPEDAATP
ncbi:hypothetical protein [Granulicella sp. S190]|uniref:hypothetical protein n=1 Tax=Granulicella sp. S190 TaxID=1747226 RepID=UPI0020B1300F|nr:hypothetical protein [Granulicella sp. S190]